MKIELIKEISASGSVRYITEIDGVYCDKSASESLEVAMRNYETIKLNYATPVREVLKSEELPLS